MTDPLIHIGYHKTGTTWLQRRIFTSDDAPFVRVWPKKVIDAAFVTVNAFDYEPEGARALIEPFLQDAERSDRVAVISHERLSGFDLLGGYDAQPIAERIHRALPNGRVLIVIREQRDMMLSMYKQYVKKSGPERIEVLWRKRNPRESRRPGPTLEVYEYHHLIAYYQRLFGPDRVLVLPYEQLRADPDGFIASICSFAGVPVPSAGMPTGAENVAVPGALTALLRYGNVLLRGLGMVPPYGAPISKPRVREARNRFTQWLGPKLPKRLSKGADRRMREAVERVAAGRFAQSNRITASLTGLDLASLGYDVE